jgi:hypothetical protein
MGTKLFRRLARFGVPLVVFVLAGAAPLSVQASTTPGSAGAGSTTVAAAPSKSKSVVRPAWGCAWDCGYITNIRVTGYPKYNVAQAYVQGWGPSHPSVSVAISTSNGYSATVGIDFRIINASISGNVTQTYTVQYSNTLDVPAGQCWGTQGFIMFKNVSFQIWTREMYGDDQYLGTGTAWYYAGMGFWPPNWCR